MDEIVGLRNLIAHEYFRIDPDVIETIVEGTAGLARSGR
jgi:uncharacterized protein YutE (UPF0331/DUF86 family)